MSGGSRVSSFGPVVAAEGPVTFRSVVLARLSDLHLRANVAIPTSAAHMYFSRVLFFCSATACL